jgi:Ni,Fe-hydrogenase III large subunit
MSPLVRSGRFRSLDGVFGQNRFRKKPRLERCKVKDRSVNNWPALVEAVKGNIIADFPVINKSFNLSYSGTDR